MSKQVLSAAVDAAATDAEWDDLLLASEQGPEINAEWSRIWEWRDARDGVALAGSQAFCSGVMAAIAAEQPLPSNVVSLPAKPAAVAVRGRASWRSLVPLSAAAGIAAAVLTVGALRDPAEAPGALATAGSAVATTPARVGAGQVQAEIVTADAAQAAVLSAYLMEHSNLLAERSMGGTLANARFAARTADYRPDAQ